MGLWMSPTDLRSTSKMVSNHEGRRGGGRLEVLRRVVSTLR